VLAVDTNVVVRFLTQDDMSQAARAASLIRANDVWVAKTVLLETEWVLRSLYGFRAKTIVAGLRALAGLPNVHLEDPGSVAQALEWYQAGLDFADALHLGSCDKGDGFATFDDKLARGVRRLRGPEIVSM